jgi:hypothetical protein
MERLSDRRWNGNDIAKSLDQTPHMTKAFEHTGKNPVQSSLKTSPDFRQAHDLWKKI